MSEPKEAVAAIQATLPEVESALASLLEKPWAETVDQLSPLDRAKMDTLLAYTINDLVWVYMKMKGIDPQEHEVSKELDRVRTYYGKVKQAEEPESRRSMTVNTAAASRLIRASIPSSQRTVAAGASAAVSSSAAETSAAARAKREHEAAVAEQLERVGMGNRFRFVGAGAEKVLPPGVESPGQGGQGEGLGMEVVDDVEHVGVEVDQDEEVVDEDDVDDEMDS